MGGRFAQAWGFDLMIATAIFFATVFAFFLYSINYPLEGQEDLSRLEYEADLIAQSLMSEGYPTDWNASSVVTIGILSSGKIDEDKLAEFQGLVANDYEVTRNLFNINNDYYIEITGVDPIGEIPADPESLIKVDRLTIYQDKPVTLSVNVWK